LNRITSLQFMIALVVAAGLHAGLIGFALLGGEPANRTGRPEPIYLEMLTPDQTRPPPTPVSAPRVEVSVAPPTITTGTFAPLAPLAEAPPAPQTAPPAIPVPPPPTPTSLVPVAPMPATPLSDAAPAPPALLIAKVAPVAPAEIPEPPPPGGRPIDFDNDATRLSVPDAPPPPPKLTIAPQHPPEAPSRPKAPGELAAASIMPEQFASRPPTEMAEQAEPLMVAGLRPMREPEREAAPARASAPDLAPLDAQDPTRPPEALVPSHQVIRPQVPDRARSPRLAELDFQPIAAIDRSATGANMPQSPVAPVRQSAPPPPTLAPADPPTLQNLLPSEDTASQEPLVPVAPVRRFAPRLAGLGPQPAPAPIPGLDPRATPIEAPAPAPPDLPVVGDLATQEPPAPVSQAEAPDARSPAEPTAAGLPGIAPDRFETILQNIENLADTPAPSPEPEAAPAPVDPIDRLLAQSGPLLLAERGLSSTETTSISRQIQTNWSLPVGLAPSEAPEVKLDIRLGPDGRVINVALVDWERAQTDHIYRITAESAIRAVLRTAQIDGLAPDRHYLWEDVRIKFKFDPGATDG
jgi:hypothetical protein